MTLVKLTQFRSHFIFHTLSSRHKMLCFDRSDPHCHEFYKNFQRFWFDATINVTHGGTSYGNGLTEDSIQSHWLSLKIHIHFVSFGRRWRGTRITSPTHNTINMILNCDATDNKTENETKKINTTTKKTITERMRNKTANRQTTTMTTAAVSTMRSTSLLFEKKNTHQKCYSMLNQTVWNWKFETMLRRLCARKMAMCCWIAHGIRWSGLAMYENSLFFIMM